MSALIYAQDQRDDTKPPQEEPRPEATKPGDEAKTPRQQDETKPAKQQDEAKPPRDENKAELQENAKPSEHAEQSPQNAQHAASAHGGHIPDDKFRAHFGRQHTVVINRPTIVEGQPRFQYSGYWFTIVDPWPASWAYSDQCYIDYVDGEYFLFDLLHPGVRVALFVVL